MLLVDDHDLIRTGIKRLFDDISGIRVVAEAASGEEAVDWVRHNRPDVVMMDINMPGIGGFEATRKIKLIDSSIPVIILSVHSDGPYPGQLLKVGADGYLHKGCSFDEMSAAVKAVTAGERYISNEVAQALAISWLPGSEESPVDTLSKREIQIMGMLVEGSKIAAIAEQLCLSPKTVSTYRSRIIKKLGVENDAGLIRMAMKYGLIKEGE